MHAWYDTVGSRSVEWQVPHVQACPVDAITPGDMVPPEWQDYIEKNAAYFRRDE